MAEAQTMWLCRCGYLNPGRKPTCGDCGQFRDRGRPMAEPIKRHGPFVRENDGLWESYIDGNYIADHATRTEALAALGIAEDRGQTHTQNKENEHGRAEEQASGQPRFCG